MTTLHAIKFMLTTITLIALACVARFGTFNTGIAIALAATFITWAISAYKYMK